MVSSTLGGAVWIVSGMAVVALSDNLLPLVSGRMSVWQFQALRAGMVVPLAVIFAIAIGQGMSLIGRSQRRLAERSLMATAALSFYFTAIPAVGITQAAAGLFTAPLWVVALSVLLFGESVGPRRILAGLIGFAGVVLVLEVGTAPVQPMALAAVAGGACYALSVIWTRRHCRNETAIAMATWQYSMFCLVGWLGLALLPAFGPLLAGVEGTAFATRPWVDMDAADWVIVFTIGTTGIVATGMMAQGYRMGESTVLCLFDFSFLLWAPFFAWWLWGDGVSLRAVAGMGMIGLAGSLAIWSTRRRNELATE